MKLLRRPEWALLAFILVYSFVPTVGGLIRVLELAGGPTIAPPNPRALADPLPITFHILTSIVFCIAGALQFLPSFRRHSPACHRINGRVVAIAGGASAATGLWMTHVYTFPADLQGSLLYWVRMVLGSSMIILIVWAVLAIRAHDRFRHTASMLRAYAIGQGASTQTIMEIAWIVFAGSEASGSMRDVIMVSAWILNLAVAEVLIGRLPKPGTRRTGPASQRSVADRAKGTA
jgi:hypothetical protein